MPLAGFEPVSSSESLLEFETDALNHSAATAGFILPFVYLKDSNEPFSVCVCVCVCAKRHALSLCGTLVDMAQEPTPLQREWTVNSPSRVSSTISDC